MATRSTVSWQQQGRPNDGGGGTKDGTPSERGLSVRGAGRGGRGASSTNGPRESTHDKGVLDSGPVGDWSNAVVNNGAASTPS